VQWLAWRPATGESFEAIVAPRGPLAPSASVQLRIDAATLAAGEPWAAFRARWEAFVREDDVLCGWGHFPIATLANEDIRLPGARLDARVVASQLMGARGGTPEDCARRLEELGRAPRASGALAPGSGGVRMEAIRRIVGALLDAPDAAHSVGASP
jgi:hypothetical protein